MTQTFTILKSLPTLNEHDRDNRTNKFVGSKSKRIWTEFVKIQAINSKLKSHKGKVEINFYWYVPNLRSDPDNVVFAKKYILDGLVTAKVLINDSMRYIKKFSDNWELDKDNPRVEIRITDL